MKRTTTAPTRRRKAMCGRFALTLPLEAVARLFAARPGVGAETFDRPRYNIRPTEQVWAVARADPADPDPERDPARVIAPMRWGFLPHWAKSDRTGPPIINARSETIAEKPAFKKSVRERRCLVPADGFYEWETVDPDAPKPRKIPHWIHAAEGGPIAFAGVWRVWVAPDGREIPSVAIVTTAANAAMAPLHERLPVVVPSERFGLWLGEDGHGAARLMTAPDEAFYAHHAVSTMINKGGRDAPDGPELRVPAEGGPLL